MTGGQGLTILACAVRSLEGRRSLPVLLSELDGDVVLAYSEATILLGIGSGGVLRLEELDEGEALDSTEVGRALVHVPRNVDVADGSILLKHAAELLDGDIARQVAGDDSLDTRCEVRYNDGRRGLLQGSSSLKGCRRLKRRSRRRRRLKIHVLDEVLRLAVELINLRDVTPVDAVIPQVPGSVIIDP